MSGQGCPLCKGSRVSKNKTYSKQSFIDKAKYIHKGFYDYSCSVYKNRMTNIDINCPKHGIFNQRPMHHLYGVGCPKCGDYRVSIHGKNNGVGWTATRWAELSRKSKNFNGFKVYIIKCWNDSECFYKIGRTYQLTKKRFYGKQMPYKYEIIKEIIFDDGVCCFNKEIELKRLHREYKYLPNINFGGMYECFSQIII